LSTGRSRAPQNRARFSLTWTSGVMAAPEGPANRSAACVDGALPRVLDRADRRRTSTPWRERRDDINGLFRVGTAQVSGRPTGLRSGPFRQQDDAQRDLGGTEHPEQPLGFDAGLRPSAASEAGNHPGRGVHRMQGTSATRLLEGQKP
jgi:hypothetical protein